jgi:hypothetical protein
VPGSTIEDGAAYNLAASLGAASAKLGTMDIGDRVTALVPLFAPYCGGLERQAELAAALALHAQGGLRGLRPLETGSSHVFELLWSGERAPQDPAKCQLSFPDLPALRYSFQVPCHQLISWLMDRRGEALPEQFWPWLLEERCLNWLANDNPAEVE